MENFPAYINMLNYVFIVMYMLSVPLETTRGEIIKTFRHLDLMGRALLANFVIIPILGFGIARIFDLPPDIKIGFLLLSMAPGGLHLMLTGLNRALRAGDTVSLTLTLADGRTVPVSMPVRAP